MTTWQKARPLAVAMLCGGALMGALSAHAVVNPPIRMAHGIEYMSGGIGSDESKLMETVSPRWAATLEFTVKDGKAADFASDVRVTVRDSGGNAVLDQVTSNGPFLLARLDPGRYEVEATLGGQTLKQPLTVMVGAAAKATFVWPAGTDMASRGTRAPS
ncbi:hypothetical protein BH10PSE18_BH10PSE18_25230 [soil metagenome]